MAALARVHPADAALGIDALVARVAPRKARVVLGAGVSASCKNKTNISRKRKRKRKRKNRTCAHLAIL